MKPVRRKSMSVRKIQTEAASKAINKWVGQFEDEFDIQADKGKPTIRMKSIIRKLKKKLKRSRRCSRKKS